MFATLKNKIKEETGADLANPSAIGQRLLNNNNNNNRLRSRFSSTVSVNADDALAESEHLCHLRSQCNELSTKVASLSMSLQQLQEEKLRVDKTNEILLESVKVAQTQKDLYCEEQEKIQNIQQHEIDKLKNLLSFREQEAVDRLSATRQLQQQTEHLTQELERLKPMEPIAENLRDELERLRHQTQIDKNQLTTTLAAVEEENRHMKMRMKIVEEARLETLKQLNAEEQVKAMVHERKLLEQHLEEAHLQLSDIKSSWSGQNLALETQVSRLSKQVAEETTEKRKALKARDDANERVKQLEFELQQLQHEMQQRENKIKLLEEEVDELNLALKECRDENEQQILFERNKSDTLQIEANELRARIEAAEERFTEYAENAEQVAQKLRHHSTQQQDKLIELQNQIECEREEKLTALLRNAEISQSEERLKQELRMERSESHEMTEKNKQLQTEVQTRQREIATALTELETLRQAAHANVMKIKEVDELLQEITEKNKTIKMLNQRLADLKKTLQKEFLSVQTGADAANEQCHALTEKHGHVCNTRSINNTTEPNTCSSGNSSIIMDEVNFKYLKHVIVKFLTSREVEARQLIRAVATLLQLTPAEEQLLHDTLNWKISWFGSGQRALMPS